MFKITDSLKNLDYAMKKVVVTKTGASKALDTKKAVTHCAHNAEKFAEFLDLFIDYNSKVNLSSIRLPDAIVEKHFVDSLALIDVPEFPSFAKKAQVLDVGTGGGFPGIPLKIVDPSIQLTLLDSVGKKVTACRYFVDELGFDDVATVQGRVEDLLKIDQAYLYKFDVIVARATAYLPTLLTWLEPLLAADGAIWVYKTPSTEELTDGVAAAKDLRLSHMRTLSYELAGQERQLMEFKRASK
jgi:16S rRNA (guanine527-N7)-methyltransferase